MKDEKVEKERGRDDGRWDETHGDHRCGVMTLYPIRCTRHEAQDGCKRDCTSEGPAAMPNTARYVVYVELIKVVQCSDRPHPEYERLRRLRSPDKNPRNVVLSLRGEF